MDIFRKVQKDTHTQIRRKRIQERLDVIEKLLSKPRLPAGDRKRLSQERTELRKELESHG